MVLFAFLSGAALFSLGLAWAHEDARPSRQLGASLVITLGTALALPALVVWVTFFSTLGIVFLF